MVVAARASNRSAHEGFRCGVDLLIHHVVNHLHAVLLRQRLRTERQEARGDDSALTLTIVFRG